MSTEKEKESSLQEARTKLLLAGWTLTEKKWCSAEMEGTVLLHLRVEKSGNSPFALTKNTALTVEELTLARLDILEYTMTRMYQDVLSRMEEDKLL